MAALSFITDYYMVKFFSVLSSALLHKIICGLIGVIFVLLSLYIAPYHELWADEVQAFLIARDAPFADIVSIIPHQEGQPALWHLLLKGLIFLFGENLNITYVSITIMALTVSIFLFGYQVPLFYKILIPFGHYFLYQYNIISRNYCLAYLALAILGYLYPLRHKHIWCYAFALLLLAESTSFYAPVAAVLGGLWFYEAFYTPKVCLKNYYAPFLGLCGFGLLFLWQILPINTAQYNIRIDDIKNYPYNVIAHFPEAFFAGENIILNLLFLFVFAWLAIKFVAMPDFSEKIKKHKKTIGDIIFIWTIFIAVYFTVRPMFYHQGLIWGLFLCSVYMFFPNYIGRRCHYLFIACLLMQIYWSFVSISFDIKHPYSAQLEVMQILQKQNLLQRKIQTIGFHTLPLQTLLSRENLCLSSDTPLYWQWTQDDLKLRYADIQKMVDEHHDILVVDAFEAPRIDLSYYENPDVFYIYKIPAAAVYKGYLFYEQGLYLYIKKSLPPLFFNS